MEVYITDDLKPASGIDLMVFPADRLSSFLESQDGPVPFFCTGTARQIRHAIVLGAGDFLREPWDWPELQVRAAGFLHRKAALHSVPTPPDLTFTELRLLWKLGESRGDVVSRELLGTVIPSGSEDSRVLDVHISSLRKKLDSLLPHWEGKILKTVRNRGYRLDFVAYRAISMVR